MKIAAGICLTTQDGRTLLVRDRQSKLWGFPAGKVEDNGESPEECARREFMEEMGRTFTDPLTSCGATEREGVLFHAFKGSCPEAFQPALGKEHTEYAWINMGVDMLPGQLYDNVLPICGMDATPGKKPDDEESVGDEEKFMYNVGDLEFLDTGDKAMSWDDDGEEEEEEDDNDYFSEPDDDGEEEDDDEYELVDEEEEV